MFSKNLFGVDFFAGKQSVYHGFCQALKFACVCEFVWVCPVFLLHSPRSFQSEQSLTPRLHRCPSVQGSDIEPGAVQFINHGKQTDYLSRASMQKNQD